MWYPGCRQHLVTTIADWKRINSQRMFVCPSVCMDDVHYIGYTSVTVTVGVVAAVPIE